MARRRASSGGGNRLDELNALDLVIYGDMHGLVYYGLENSSDGLIGFWLGGREVVILVLGRARRVHARTDVGGTPGRIGLMRGE